MEEDQNTEFKVRYTDNILKVVVSFLNTNSGTIYIGYNDNGELVGLMNAKATEERISHKIRDCIVPDPSIFVSINIKNYDNKDFIVIHVSKGGDVYSLKAKGGKKKIYIRTGSHAVPASEDTIKMLLIRNNKISFETSVSVKQNLTFVQAENVFKDNGLDIYDKDVQTNLHLIDDKGEFTNLALLISDDNPYNYKIALYNSNNKEKLLDMKDFRGSLFKVYTDVLDYVINNITHSKKAFPSFVVKEIVLNSIVHRDYTQNTPNLINLYRDGGIEVINYGSLNENVSVNDVVGGISTSRNPFLQSMFLRLNYLDGVGNGLKRIGDYYNNMNLKMEVSALPSTFVIRLPKINKDYKRHLSDTDIILNYLKQNDYISRSYAEKLINKEKTTTSNLLNKMVNDGLLYRVGNGPVTRYCLKK